MSNTIKIVSVNCPTRVRDVFHSLRQKSYSIYLLQDTHFDPKMENCIRAESYLISFTLHHITQIREVLPHYSTII